MELFLIGQNFIIMVGISIIIRDKTPDSNLRKALSITVMGCFMLMLVAIFADIVN